MKRIITAALTLLLTTAAFGDEPVRRTVIIKDGKVITDGREVRLDDALFGGPRAYLGVSLTNLSSVLRDRLGVPKETGVLVESIEKDSPAEKAGVRAGDIILSIDGGEVDSARAVRQSLAGKKEGDSVRVEVLRDRSRQTLVAGVKFTRGMPLMQLGELPALLGSPEWRARIESLGGDCGELQTRIKDLETRLKDLEKRLHR